MSSYKTSIAACMVILLPAHPSLQLILHERGIPASLVAALLAIPVFIGASKLRFISWDEVKIFGLFAVYIGWMLFTAAFSPAIGQVDYYNSLRGLLLLLPLSVLCGYFSSRFPNQTAQAIQFLGVIALFHFAFVMIFGGVSSEVRGFSSLYSKDDSGNYQATSFYLGLVGVSFIYPIVKSNWIKSSVGLVGFISVLLLMGVVGARSSMVSLIAVVCFSFFMLIAVGDRRNMLWFAVVGVAVLLLIMLYADYDTMNENFIAFERFSVLSEGGDSSSREYLFQKAIEMWFSSASNFLFGGGLGAYPIFIEANESGWYPHNFVLESLAEGGVIAGLILLVIFVKMFRLLHYSSKYDRQWADLYIGWLAFYACVAYQFMGGIQTLWIPLFFVSFFLFSQSGRKK